MTEKHLFDVGLLVGLRCFEDLVVINRFTISVSDEACGVPMDGAPGSAQPPDAHTSTGLGQPEPAPQSLKK
ncbi:hypothetical protein HDU90_003901 [Geranomyces variabilis]|nr:hypothetical protein HDU90_003901 [Geranomyces variabilis]